MRWYIRRAKPNYTLRAATIAHGFCFVKQQIHQILFSKDDSSTLSFIAISPLHFHSLIAVSYSFRHSTG